MNDNTEFRSGFIELRATKDSGKPPEITGYAVKFDSMSENLGGFIERISPTAFAGVDMSSVLALYNHDVSKVLARNDSGTLDLSVDSIGLKFTARLADTTLARDVLADIEAGNVKGCSFGFRVGEDEWQWGMDGAPDVRTITQISKLVEISLTPIPAYTDTSVVKRSFKEQKNKVSNNLRLLTFYEMEK